jgi:hypothetical protein
LSDAMSFASQRPSESERVVRQIVPFVLAELPAERQGSGKVVLACPLPRNIRKDLLVMTSSSSSPDSLMRCARADGQHTASGGAVRGQIVLTQQKEPRSRCARPDALGLRLHMEHHLGLTLAPIAGGCDPSTSERGRCGSCTGVSWKTGAFDPRVARRQLLPTLMEYRRGNT